VILVPVVTGNSTIPNWVLSKVTRKRTRTELSSFIRGHWIHAYHVAGWWSGLFVSANRKGSFGPFLGVANWDLIGSFLISAGLTYWFIRDFVIVCSARYWLDKNHKWPEVESLQWQEPPKSRFNPVLPNWIVVSIFCLIGIAFIIFWILTA
jgi:hypothetical protein